MAAIGGGRCRISSGLALLVCAVLLSAATMANGIRTGETGGMVAPVPAASARQAAATLVTSPPVDAAATTPPPLERPALEDPYKNSKRKVPNGPDPIHNR
jgi:hypothetical protein